MDVPAVNAHGGGDCCHDGLGCLIETRRDNAGITIAVRFLGGLPFVA